MYSGSTIVFLSFFACALMSSMKLIPINLLSGASVSSTVLMIIVSCTGLSRRHQPHRSAGQQMELHISAGRSGRSPRQAGQRCSTSLTIIAFRLRKDKRKRGLSATSQFAKIARNSDSMYSVRNSVSAHLISLSFTVKVYADFCLYKHFVRVTCQLFAACCFILKCKERICLLMRKGNWS